MAWRPLARFRGIACPSPPNRRPRHRTTVGDGPRPSSPGHFHTCEQSIILFRSAAAPVSEGVKDKALASAPAEAQVAADLVAVSGIPAGNTFAPRTAAGMLMIITFPWIRTISIR